MTSGDSEAYTPRIFLNVESLKYPFLTLESSLQKLLTEALVSFCCL